MNKARALITQVVNRAIANGMPVITEIAPPRAGVSRYPSARVTDRVEDMMPRIRAAKQARHLTKPGRSATHFEEP